MCHLKHWSHAKWSYASYCDDVWSGCPSGIAQWARMEISRCLKVLVFLRAWLCKSLTPWVMALFYKTLVPSDTHPLDCDHGHGTSSFRSIVSTGVWPRGCSSLVSQGRKSACIEVAQTKPEACVLSWNYNQRAARTGLYHGVNDTWKIRQINSQGQLQHRSYSH